MHIKTISHVGITVRNLEESIKFYQDILSFKLISEPGAMMGGREVETTIGVAGSKHRTCMLEIKEGHILELMEFEALNLEIDKPSPINTIGSHHIAYLVDDIYQWVSHLTKKGIFFFSEPLLEETEAGAILWVLFRDPNGITIELIEER